MRPLLSVLKGLSFVLVPLGLTVLPRLAAAADVIFDHLAPSTIKLDGKTKEWPGSTPGSETIKSGKMTATFYAGYDDSGIWVGADVNKDGTVSRTSSFGPNEDCVSLVIAFPSTGVSKGAGASEYTAYEVGFYAGVPGSSAGVVKMRAGPGAGKTIAGSQIVEAPIKKGGYAVEGFVPWSAFPEAKKVRSGLRGALRAYDGNTSSIVAIKATGSGSVDSPSSLGFLLIEPEQSIPSALAAKKLTWKDFAFDVHADLAGDGTAERALFLGRNAFVFGPTYKEGKQYLQMDAGADVVGVEARDVTGDGKADLLVTTRIKTGGTTREALVVYSLTGGTKGAETPVRAFTHETLVDSGTGNVLKDSVVFAGGKKPTATVTYLPAKGWDVNSYKEPIVSDIDPILFPWGTVKERVFSLAGNVFVKDKEVAQKGTAPAATTTPTSGTSTTTAGTTSTPAPVGDGALVAFKAYRKDKGLPADAAAKIDVPATIAPGKKGRAALFGRDLVLAIGGTETGYAVITMSRFANEKDIFEITAKDLTGDGRDELIVRGVIRGKLTGPSGEKEVLREVLSVYQPKAAGAGLGIHGVFNAEIARAIGTDRVDASLRIVTAKGTTPGKIELGKGTAKGWTEKTYPFGTETANAQLEPLILPWGKETTVTYSWTGEKFDR